VWDGRWHAVAGSYDGSTVRLYLDGVQVGSGTTASGSIDYAAFIRAKRDLTVGDYPDSEGSCGSPQIRANVDEARVYGSLRSRFFKPPRRANHRSSPKRNPEEGEEGEE
jgi:hypothetical protein